MDGAGQRVKAGQRRRGLKRRVVGWVLVVVSVVVMGLSWWSRGRDWTVFAEGRGYEGSVSVTSGVVQGQVIRGGFHVPFHHQNTVAPEGPLEWRTSFHRVQESYRWWRWAWFRAVQPTGSNTFAAVPLWVPALAAVAGGAGLVAWGSRARRRAMENRCARCGYDLRGLERGVVCPECGR